MITKQQQEILDNAPEGATHWMTLEGYKPQYGFNYRTQKGDEFTDEWDSMSLTRIADLRKQGKTVWDAVNYYHADICIYDSEHSQHNSKNTKLIYKANACGYFNSDVHIDGYELFCTIEEFNQCVKELERFANKKQGEHSPYTDYNYTRHKLENPLEPIKPRMKVEYVKVNPNKEGGTYWECARDFAELDVNSLVARTNPDECSVMSWMNIKDNDELLRTYKKGKVYRKIETEITWQDEALAFFSEYKTIDMCVYINFVNSNGNTAMQSSFIKMCHLVSSMNK